MVYRPCFFQILVVLLLLLLPDPCHAATPTPTPRSADLDGDQNNDPDDLFLFLLSWKKTGASNPADLDGNGQINSKDLILFITAWYRASNAGPTRTPTKTSLVTATRTRTRTNTSLPTMTRTRTPTPTSPGSGVITINLPNLAGGAKPLRMVRIPAGAFMMGNPGTERENDCMCSPCDCEKPQHSVNIGYDFYMAETEITQAQWQALMGNNPSWGWGVGNDHPVYFVDWGTCQSFVIALNSLGQGTFRLPSEAEWEYACRSHQTTPFSFGDDLDIADLDGPCQFSTLFDTYMWWCGNAGVEPNYTSHPVASKLPNGFGLYDMHGNVQEWCQDRWHETYVGAPNNGSAWESGDNTRRVYRGGYWGHASDNRSAWRFRSQDNAVGYDIGFRVARNP